MVTKRSNVKRKVHRNRVTSQVNVQQHAAKKRAILVLGMHRSGTSALTRVFNLLGADLPKNVMGPGVGNDLGHWESIDLVVIHDEMLNAAGTTWHDWRSIKDDWMDSAAAETFKEQLLAVMRRDYTNSSLFTVKDPRICRFVPLWLDVLRRSGVTPIPVLPIRNPLEVAASLRRRDKFALTKSYLIWLRHVLDAERETRNLARAIVTYDVLMDDWRAVAASVSDRTKLRWPLRSDRSEMGIDRFLTNAHRHHTADETQLNARADVAGWVKEAYAVLKDMSQRPETKNHHHALDRIGAEFDKAADAFGLLLAGETEDAETRIRDADNRTQAALNEQKSASSMLRERDAMLAETTGALHQAQQHVANYADRARRLEDELITIRGQLHEAEDGAATGQQEIERLQRELDATRILLRESQSQAQRLSGDIAQAEQSLSEQLSQIATITSERESARANLAAREIDLLNLRVALQRIEQTTDVSLRTKNVDLAAANARAKDAEERFETSRRELDLLKSELSTSRHLLHEKQIDEQRLREETTRANQGRYEAEAQVAEILAEREKAIANSREDNEKIRRQLTVTQTMLRDTRQENELIETALKSAQQSIQESTQDRLRLTQEIIHAREAAVGMNEKIRHLQIAHDSLQHRDEEARRAEQEVESLRDTMGRFQAQARQDIAMHEDRTARLEQELESLRVKAEALRAQKLSDEKRRRDIALAPKRSWLLRNLWRRSKKSRAITDIDAIRRSELFNPLWYLERYPDVAAAGQDPLVHYVLHGGGEARDPHPLFDAKWYIARYPDYAESGLSPLGHYIIKGIDLGNDPNALFDTDWYLQQHPEVADNGLHPLHHFWTIGTAKGFDPGPGFNTKWYLQRNPDVARTGDNCLLHYLTHGIQEGRAPKP